MGTIAVVGAGPGLGLSIARVFGRRGFSVALISRTQEKLDDLVARLEVDGVEAAGFAGDVVDRPSLVEALGKAQERFGSIDVLEYSPGGGPPAPMAKVLDLTAENIQPFVEWQLYGAIAATNQVLPGMIERGEGALFYTSGASSVQPAPRLANFATAAAGLRHYVFMLHPVLARRGVYAAHVPIGVFIGQGGPKSDPDTIAQVYWDLYCERRDPERRYGTMPEELLGID